MKKIYDVDYKKLALLLLPTFLRNSVLSAFLHAAVAPLSELHTRFLKFIEEKNVRLFHNGQVCYLRAILNDKFDNEQRRIYIDNAIPTEGTILYVREKYMSVLIPLHSGTALKLSRRGYGGIDGLDFTVVIPVALYNIISESELKALVNIYKLASKRYGLNYK